MFQYTDNVLFRTIEKLPENWKLNIVIMSLIEKNFQKKSFNGHEWVIVFVWQSLWGDHSECVCCDNRGPLCVSAKNRNEAEHQKHGRLYRYLYFFFSASHWQNKKFWQNKLQLERNKILTSSNEIKLNRKNECIRMSISINVLSSYTIANIPGLSSRGFPSIRIV